MLNRSILITLLGLVVILSGCSSAKQESAGEEMALDDGYKVNQSNEVVIDDSAFNDKNHAVRRTTEAKEEATRTAADNSKITRMDDGHGNITETRNFPDSARIRMLIVRTGADGKRQVFVYGQDGMVKELPAEKHDVALTASATEIADELKMYGGKIVKLKPIVNQPLRPLPSSEFPVKNRTAQVAEQQQTTP